MRPTTLTLTATGASAPLPVDWRTITAKIGFGGVLTTTGTGTIWKVQHTFDNILDPSSGYTATNAYWFDHEFVNAATGADDGNYDFPFCACRIAATAFLAGSSLRVTFYTAGG